MHHGERERERERERGGGRRVIHHRTTAATVRSDAEVYPLFFYRECDEWPTYSRNLLFTCGDATAEVPALFRAMERIRNR